jgi:hypothetical protein
MRLNNTSNIFRISLSLSIVLHTGTHPIFNTLQDIVLYKGQLHAISIYKALFSLTVSATEVTDEQFVARIDRVISCPRQIRLFKFKDGLSSYLFESNGTLLMIYRRRELRGVMPEKATKFVVFVADFERSSWKRAERSTELLREAVPDDRVLFLGRWCCRSVGICLDHHDKGYIDMGGSSIVFFSDDDHGAGDDHHRKRVPFYCSVYNVKTGRSQLLMQLSVRPLKGFQPTWLFPHS